MADEPTFEPWPYEPWPVLSREPAGFYEPWPVEPWPGQKGREKGRPSPGARPGPVPVRGRTCPARHRPPTWEWNSGPTARAHFVRRIQASDTWCPSGRPPSGAPASVVSGERAGQAVRRGRGAAH